MLERDYQRDLIEKIEKLLPNCIILKNDTQYLQGIPDLTILYGGKWAVLEVKRSRTAREEPNQGWYIDTLDRMSFAAFIFPEIEEAVLDELQQALRPRRSARVPIRQ